MILVASSLVFGVACNKKEEAAVTDTMQAVTDVAAKVGDAAVVAVKEVVVNGWDKSVVNGLLEYIPADSSMVYASTRALDLDNPLMKAYLAKSEKMLESMSDNLAKLDPEEQAEVIKFYAAVVELSKNYETIAPEWGLDAKGRTDLVMYSTDTKLVVKMSLADGTKTKAKAMELSKEVEDLRVNDITVGSEQWTLLGANENDMLKLAVHFGTDKLTLSIVFDATQDLSYLNALLAPVANPMSKDALGTLSAETAGIGFSDNVKVLAQALNPNTDLGKLLIMGGEFNLSELCTSEISSLVAKFPRTELKGLVTDTDLSVHYVVKVANSDTVGELKSMLGKRIAIETAKSVGALFVSLDVGKAIDVLSKWGTEISQAPYECEDLSFINESAGSLAGLKQMASGEQFSFVNSISGMGVSLESLEMIDGMPKIAASAYFLGSDIMNAAKLGKMMLGSEVPQIAAVKVEKDVVSTIDLSDLANMPLMLQTQFTDHGLVMTTGEGVDIAAISKIEAINSNDYIGFTLDYKILGLIEESLKMDYVLNFNIGVADDGISISSTMKL